jgi:hypothetical protein
MVRKKDEAKVLKGWAAIARFLGQPVATVQPWAKSGMPVTRQGRYVYASQDELSQWLGREAGASAPIHIATDDAELAADLRRSVATVRKHRRRAM